MKLFILEDLDQDSTRSYLLWESAGKALTEVKLSPEQIGDLFDRIESSAEETGDNRTAVGKAKDAVSAAYKDLKNTVYNSKPMVGFAAKYDAAAQKVLEKLGDDSKVVGYVRRYREFANKHPIMQTVVYSVMIAAAGLSGFGVGGIALLGLFKAFDRLLLGDDIRTALFAGTKTFAAGLTVSQVLSAVNVTSTTASDVPPQVSDAASNVAGVSIGRVASEAFDVLKIKMEHGTITTWNEYQRALRQSIDIAAQELGASARIGSTRHDIIRGIIENHIGRMVADANGGSWQGNGPQKLAEFMRIIGVETPPALARDIENVIELRRQMQRPTMESISIPAASLVLTEANIKDMLRNTISWMKTKGRNITTNVTKDKLISSYKKAGSPTDSSRIARWLHQEHGIPESDIKSMLMSIGLSEKDADASLPSAPDEPAPEEVPFTSGNRTLDAEAEKVFRQDGKDAFIAWWDGKTREVEQQMYQTRMITFADALSRQDVATALAQIGTPSDLPNSVKTAMKTKVAQANISSSAKSELLSKIGANKGHWVKESEYDDLSSILHESGMSWADLGIRLIGRDSRFGRMVML